MFAQPGLIAEQFAGIGQSSHCLQPGQIKPWNWKVNVVTFLQLVGTSVQLLAGGHCGGRSVQTGQSGQVIPSTSRVRCSTFKQSAGIAGQAGKAGHTSSQRWQPGQV